LAWLDTAESWEAMLRCWRRVFEAADLQPGVDRVFFAFSFGPFLGFWTAFEAAAKDYLAIPSGGMSSEARLVAMQRYGATVLCCTPTYALRLGELAAGHPHQVRKIIVAGEPGGSVPAVRDKIESLWGARVFDHHGMTEVGPVSFERVDRPGFLEIVDDAYLAEIIDPASGEPVMEGECGELVLTTLARTACPLIRYRTGDWVRGRRLDGALCLEGGVLGRCDEMLLIRGVNVYPSAIDNIVCSFPEVVEYQIQRTTVDAMEELELKIELASGVPTRVAQQVERKLKDAFTLRIPVTVVPALSLPRHEFKAKRWQK
jgi:phenylacetate-CoA ligase